MFQAAVDAALPSICVPAYLPSRPKGRTVVIGAGKASGAMAKALEDAWDGPLEGLVVTRYGYRVPTKTRAYIVPVATAESSDAMLVFMQHNKAPDRAPEDPESTTTPMRKPSPGASWRSHWTETANNSSIIATCGALERTH